ncbi:hypothetical protein GDO81_022830 [Engystomops pustulosus]|uniref:Uncharacterized protein n=1 Tax=Engystomops pustulosus TaxID=76066 RepID=A0AAV6YQK0_ENGPU|nr:hypothetical protein GDO81_022830 [Engystomops pustulosus]
MYGCVRLRAIISFVAIFLLQSFVSISCYNILPACRSKYISGGEPVARGPEVELRAHYMGTLAITPGQGSPDRTYRLLQSQAV